MNMITKVASDGEAKPLHVKIANRPTWQRAAIFGTPEQFAEAFSQAIVITPRKLHA